MSDEILVIQPQKQLIKNFTLTESQVQKYDQVIDIGRSKRILVIKGGAGVGKTTLANKISQYYLDKYPTQKVYVTAPTNQALAIISEKVNQLNSRIELSTLQSGLGLRSKTLPSGERVFLPPASYHYKNRPFRDASLVIVDEASMVSEMLVDLMETEVGSRATIIYLGDENQLNPVGEEKSMVFHKGYAEVELVEIMRQVAGNPIIELSRNMSLIRSKVNNVVQTESGVQGYLFSNDMERIIERLVESNGSNEAKYLAYHRDQAEKMNKLVRIRRYGSPRKIEQGETISFTEPFGLYRNNEKLKVEKLKIINYKLKIPTELSEMIEPDGRVDIKNTYLLDANRQMVKDVEGNYVKTYDEADLTVYLINESVRVVHEDNTARFNSILTKMSRECAAGRMDWKARHYVADQIASFTYNHALTVHKSQGSTFKKVFINMGDIAQNRNFEEQKRMMYTAVTRASDLCVLTNVK